MCNNYNERKILANSNVEEVFICSFSLQFRKYCLMTSSMKTAANALYDAERVLQANEYKSKKKT